MKIQKDEFNPETAEKFAQMLGKFVSKRSEIAYRFGVGLRKTNPALSSIILLGFICLAANDISDKLN